MSVSLSIYIYCFGCSHTRARLSLFSISVVHICAQQACSADVVNLLEERSKSLEQELASVKEEKAALSEEMKDVQDEVAELKAMLDEVGGSQGIKRLVETAAIAAAATKKGQEAVQCAVEEASEGVPSFSSVSVALFLGRKNRGNRFLWAMTLIFVFLCVCGYMDGCFQNFILSFLFWFSSAKDLWRWFLSV